MNVTYLFSTHIVSVFGRGLVNAWVPVCSATDKQAGIFADTISSAICASSAL